VAVDPPPRFGKYALLDRVSIGGMAEVFRGRGTDGKLYAIKRILPSLAEDESFIRMFVQEARIAGQLVHPNIARIYELGRFEGTHFIAMEYVWGKDLVQIRNRCAKLKQAIPMAMTIAMMCMALDGLDYAHKKRDGFSRALDVVHRDCSPHNILLSYDGEMKIIDFGIAKARSSVVKTVGVLKGKFAYMSPEQTMGKPIDRRSDIFSMGIVLYELITGERLFVGDSDFAVLERVRTVDYRPAREIVPTLPEALEQVINRALQADRDKRYQWCGEMRDDLRKLGPAHRDELAGWLRELFSEDIANEREDLGLKIRPVRPSTPIPIQPDPSQRRSNTELEPEIEMEMEIEPPPLIDMLDFDDEQTSIRHMPLPDDDFGEEEELELLETKPVPSLTPLPPRKR
jgi:serine/threonine protein kinase